MKLNHCPTCQHEHEPAPVIDGTEYVPVTEAPEPTAMPIDTTKPTIRDHLPKLLKLLDLADKHGAGVCSISITQYGSARLHLEDDSAAAVDAIADELGMTGTGEKYRGIYTRSNSDYTVFCGHSAATCSCGTPCDHTSAS